MTDSLKRAAHYAGVASEIGDMIATTIHAKRLDRVLSENNYNRIDILVIDVEGHELAVLNSLSDPETFPKLAIIECNGRDLSRQAEYIEIFHQWACAYGEWETIFGASLTRSSRIKINNFPT